MLVRDDYEKTIIGTTSSQRLFPAPKSTLFASLTRGDSATKVNVLDIDANENKEVFSVSDYVFAEEGKENIEWSIGSDQLAIPLWKDDHKDYFIVNTETKESTNLRDLAGGGDVFRAVRWDSSRNNTLFFLADGSLYEMDITDSNNKILIAKDVQSYDISGDYIYTFRVPSGIVEQTRLGDLENSIQITATPVSDVSNPNYSLIVYDDSRLALLNYQTGNLYTYIKGEKENFFQRLATNVRGAQFSNDGKKLLYWSDWEIFTYFTRKWESQPIREENTIINIGRFSQHISNVHWAQDYEHVLFSVGSEIKMIELDQRERMVVTLLTLPAAPIQVLSNFFENKLFYILPSDSNTSNVSSINFPEETGLFGFGG